MSKESVVATGSLGRTNDSQIVEVWDEKGIRYEARVGGRTLDMDEDLVQLSVRTVTGWRSLKHWNYLQDAPYDCKEELLIAEAMVKYRVGEEEARAMFEPLPEFSA